MNETDMIYLIAVVQLGSLITVYAADLKCPSAAQWRLRAQSYCEDEGEYTCLYFIDANEQKYTEKCNGPRKESPGEKTVINSGNFNNVDCSKDRYQPILFSTTEGSNCMFLKSNCSEEGQLVHSNGSTREDRTCSCNYKQQYAFVSQSRSHPRYCTPSVEDCSCYKKRCKNGFKLSAEYECVPVNETHDFKENVKYMLTTNEIKPDDSTETFPVEKYNTVYVWSVRVFVLSMSCVIAVTVIVTAILLICNKEHYLWWCCWYTRKRLQKLQLVTHLKSPVICIEGQNITLSCTVNKKNQVSTWKWNGNIVQSERSATNTHELVLDNISVDKRGQYSVEFKNKLFSNALVKVSEKITTGEINYFRMKLILDKAAEPVVRLWFDKEFHPKRLGETLKHNKFSKFKKLKKHKHINEAEYKLLFPTPVDEYSVNLEFKKMNFSSELGDKDSDAFKELANRIVSSVNDQYSKVRVTEMQDVKVQQFQPGLRVTLTMTSNPSHGANEAKLSGVLKDWIATMSSNLSLDTQPTGFKLEYIGTPKPKVSSSKDFDIRLMMIIMRNLTNLEISDTLPDKSYDTASDHLSSIKYYRNKFKQNSDRSLTDEEFENDYDRLFQALKRLEELHVLGGDKYQKICDDIKKQIPSQQQCIESLALTSLQPESSTLSTLSVESYTDALYRNENLRRDARRAVRELFDKEIPPDTLKEVISNQRKELQKLKDDKGITQSEWESLFPYSGIPSSGSFDMKIMKILLEITTTKESPIVKAMENLCNHFSKIKMALVGDDDSIRREITYLETNINQSN